MSEFPSCGCFYRHLGDCPSEPMISADSYTARQMRGAALMHSASRGEMARKLENRAFVVQRLSLTEIFAEVRGSLGETFRGETFYGAPSDLRATLAMREEDSRIARKHAREAAERPWTVENRQAYLRADEWLSVCTERERIARRDVLAGDSANDQSIYDSLRAADEFSHGLGEIDAS